MKPGRNLELLLKTRKVRSTCRTVLYLQWNFYAIFSAFTYFDKKAPSQIFDWVLNTPLKAMNGLTGILAQYGAPAPSSLLAKTAAVIVKDSPTSNCRIPIAKTAMLGPF